jgi:hypothetical protein
MVPGQPKLGQKFYQEIAPKVALDRVEIVSTDETVKTPAGTFRALPAPEGNHADRARCESQVLRAGNRMIKDDAFELAEKP